MDLQHQSATIITLFLNYKIYNIPSTISNNYGLYSSTNFYSLHITTTTCVYLAFSDGSVSDEDDDSLIEIFLPGSKFGGLDEEPKQKAQSNLPDLLLEFIFQQQGLMEILAEINEMNEEENLIEIDLSMGSNLFKARD